MKYIFSDEPLEELKQLDCYKIFVDYDIKLLVYILFMNVNFKRNCIDMPVNYLTKLIKFSFYIDNPLY